MAIQSKVGSFQFGALIAGQVLSITDLGFQPTAIMFWWTGSTSDTTTRKTIYGGRSVTTGVGAGKNYYSTFTTTDNVTTTDTSRSISASTGRTIATAPQGHAELQSFDADGFSLLITQTFSTNPEIQYMAIGGTDEVLLTSFNRTNTPGTGSVNLGFQPNAVFFLTGTSTYNLQPSQYGQEVFGWAIDEGFGSPKNGSISWFARDNIISSNSTTSRGWNLSNTNCYSHIMINGSTLSHYNKLTVTGFTATGFDTDWESPFSNGGNTIWCLAIKGGHWKAGTYNGTVNIPTSFTPNGFITQGGQLTTIPSGVSIGSIMRSFGAASSDPSTVMKTLNHTDAVASTSRCYTSSEANKIFENTLPSNGSNVSTATMTFNSDSVDITATGNEQRLYLIFGNVDEIGIIGELISDNSNLNADIEHEYNLQGSLLSGASILLANLATGDISISAELISDNSNLNAEIIQDEAIFISADLYASESSLSCSLEAFWEWNLAVQSGPASLSCNMNRYAQIGLKGYITPLKLISTHPVIEKGYGH